MKKMNHFKQGMSIIAYFVIIAFLISVSSVAMGTEKGGKNNQKGYVKPPMPEVTYRHIGFVQRVGDNEIVVDDHLLKFARNVVYHATEPGGKVSRQIKEGFQIGFKRNENKEITDIWILKSK